MLTVLYHLDGRTQRHAAVDPAWLRPDANGVVWVDLCDATPEETRVLRDVFAFHELAVEDALAATHHPKVEAYPGFLYLIVHGIDFQASRHQFATHDTDMFIGERYLVTVHSGNRRSIAYVRELCEKHDHILAHGPMVLAHRIVDRMVENYRPETDKLSARLDELEQRVFVKPDDKLMRTILSRKRDIASLRRVVQPQRDMIARLARREFPMVSESVAYGFRDVHDSLVRLNEEAAYFQERIMGLLDAHLAAVSNRLNQVMKMLTLIATLFMPMTVLTGIYGMNVALPQLPGGEAMQFYWIMGMLGATAACLVWFFYTRKWL